jgi:peptide/nickel transport system permease protein
MDQAQGRMQRGRALSEVRPELTRLQRFRRLPIGASFYSAMFVLVVMLFAAVAAPVASPHDPLQQNLASSLESPNWFTEGARGYPFGTDQVGRDILSNVISGVRVSLMVGFFASAIALAIGVTIGTIAGFFRGWLESVLMRAVDLQLSIPTELIALVVMAVIGQGLWKLIIVIGVTGWAAYARTVRGSILSEREREYVEAARAIGSSDRRLILRHLLPNVMTPVAILVAVQMPSVIMLEATLSFLGLGIPVTTPSLGLTISRGFDVLFSGHWWVVIFPGIALLLITFSINMAADSLRDILDPHYQKQKS